MNEKYKDIIGLARHQSDKRPHMSVYDRAAQFSPFAALTGHEDAINETARITERRTELDEYETDELNRKIIHLQTIESENPKVAVIYFVNDEKKSGGKYLSFTGNIKRVNEYGQLLEFTDGKKIPIRDIFGIEFLKQ